LYFDCHYRCRGGPLHIERNRAIYFITFRLAGSLPAAVVERLDTEEDNREFAREVERQLDAGHGQRWLARPRIAKLVRDALRFGDGNSHVLGPWCIMPSHVHLLVRPLGNLGLPELLHHWKSYTAHEANRLLRRTGYFWQREYFDRIVRSIKQLEAYRNYIIANPSKAGLEHWPWLGEGNVEGLLAE
jgi:putative DNA methylase